MKVMQPRPALNSVCIAARLCAEDTVLASVRFACACIIESVLCGQYEREVYVMMTIG